MLRRWVIDDQVLTNLVHDKLSPVEVQVPERQECVGPPTSSKMGLRLECHVVIGSELRRELDRGGQGDVAELADDIVCRTIR